MAADLNDLLQASVATAVATPLDVDTALAGGRTLRRRRHGAGLAGALAVVGVVGAGLLIGINDVPRPPIVATDPEPIEGALAPVEVAGALDDDATLLRVDLRPSQVPDAPQRGFPPDDAGRFMAVGPDGRSVAFLDNQVIVRDLDGSAATFDVGGAPVVAAVLADGEVVVGVTSVAGGPLDRVARGGLDGFDVASLPAPLAPQAARGGPDPEFIAVQDADTLQVASRSTRGVWTAITLWSAQVETAVAAPDVVPAETASRWLFEDGVGDGGDRWRVGRTDGMVLEVGLSGAEFGSTASNEGTASVGGRIAMGASVFGGAEGSLEVIAVLGPGDGVAAVVPVGFGTDPSYINPPRPLLSVDGALWVQNGQNVQRVVPSGGLPEPMSGAASEAVRNRSAIAPAVLPPATIRDSVVDERIVVVGPGDEIAGPSAPLTGRTIAELDGGCCWIAAAVSADGELVDSPDSGEQFRVGELRVTTPDGSTSAIKTGELFGRERDRGVALLGYDESGNLWALADRWWSFASFPDLVVRRPGEGSFTSLGHLPLRDLLDADAREVVLHIEGDEVALIAEVTDAAGRFVLGSRVVVARDGVALTKEDRLASVGSLPGTGAIASGSSSPVYAFGAAPTSALGSRDARVITGPFTGTDSTGAVVIRSSAMGGPVTAQLIGGVVAGTTTIESQRTLVMVGDPAGALAAFIVPVTDVQILTAPDGSVWAVLGRTSPSEPRFVQLLDAGWQPAE